MILAESSFTIGDNEWWFILGSERNELSLNGGGFYYTGDEQACKDRAKERLLEMSKDELAAIILGITDNTELHCNRIVALTLCNETTGKVRP